MAIEEYLFRKAEKPSEDLRRLLGTFMQIQQMKKEESQRMWQRGIKEREVTGREKLWGAQAEYYGRRPGVTGRPDLIARGGWSPEYIVEVAKHYNMAPEEFNKFSTADQGKMIKGFGEHTVETGKERAEMDRNVAKTMLDDIEGDMKALESNFWLAGAQGGGVYREEWDKLGRIKGQMIRLLATRTPDWDAFHELYDQAAGLKEPEKKEEVPIMGLEGVGGAFGTGKIEATAVQLLKLSKEMGSPIDMTEARELAKEFLKRKGAKR